MYKKSDHKTMDLSSNALQLFLDYFPLIKEYNKINIEFIEKTYYKNLLENHKNHAPFSSVNKVSVVPFFEYLNLYVYEQNSKISLERLKKKLDENDFSIFIKLLMQLTLIYEDNIRFLKRNKEENPSINEINNKKEPIILEISPIFNDKYREKSCIEEIKKVGLSTNFFVLEFENLTEVLCYIIPKETKDDSNFFPSIPPSENEFSFKIINDNFKALEKILLEEKLGEKKVKNIEEIRLLINKHIPSEFLNLINKLAEKRIKNQEDRYEERVLDSIFFEKSYDLGVVLWKVDFNFWLEYYWLTQMQRMIYVTSIELLDLYKQIYKKNSDKYDLRKNKDYKKKVDRLIYMVSKENKDLIKKFFRRTNSFYLNLIEWIGEEGFIDKLILFEDQNVKKFIDPQGLKKNISPLELFYVFLTKMVSEIDESFISNRLTLPKFYESELIFDDIKNFTSPQVDKFKMKVLTELLENKLPKLLTKEFKLISNPQTEFDIFPTYIYKISKNVIKYESSPIKESKLDTKDFQIALELDEKQSELSLTLIFVDLIMTIENGDELLYFTQIANSNYPLMSFNLDESRRVFFKMKVFLGNSYKDSFIKILESIDSMLIVAVSFYVCCIRSMFYQKPTKENLKYHMFVEWIKSLVKKELEAQNYHYDKK